MITIHSQDKANMEIVGHLLDVQTPNVKFMGITFDCATLTDADGNVFVRERKGKWIGGELGYCTCCGHEGCASDIWNTGEMNYCPNCGAKMERKQKHLGNKSDLVLLDEVKYE